MKKTIWVLTIFMTLISHASQVPERMVEGDWGSGGGNMLPIHPSSKADIRLMLKMIKHQSYEGFLNLREAARQAYPSKEYPMLDKEDLLRLKTIFNKVNLSGKEIQSLIYSTRIKKLENGPCIHKEVEHDSSADFKNNTICFSLERIENRKIPFRELSTKLTGLSIHELTHLLLGLNEDEAEFVQKIFEKINRVFHPSFALNLKIRLVFDLIFQFSEFLDSLEKEVNAKESFTQICNSIGYIDGTLENELSAITQSSFFDKKHVFSEEAIKLSEKILEGSDLFGICDQGDRIKYKEIREKTDDLRNEIFALSIELLGPPYSLKCDYDKWSCIVQ